METITRFFKQPKQSFFLFGPRGTGKSTLAKQQFPKALMIDLLDPSIFRLYSAKPERLKERIFGNLGTKMIIIDEIQKIPELLDVVHSLIELKKGYVFILTGSSARKIKRSGVDLLAGRAIMRTLHPFMGAELGKKFDLQSALNNGMLPLVFAAKNPNDVLQTYTALYIKEEVHAEGLVRNIGNFARFLETISFSHASILNIAHVAREAEVERKTAEGYVEIIKDLLLAFPVPVFTKRAKRRTIARSKFYFFDAGVFRSLRPSGPLDHPEEIEGAALEGLVAQHLKAWIAYQENKNKLYFWRTRNGLEVDFIIYGNNTFVAIEVKNSNRIRPEDTRALRAFKQDYPNAQTILLYRGSERLLVHDVLCIPCDEFLTTLHPDKSI